MKNKKIITGVLLTAIVGLAFFVRIYNINQTPPGIYPDEAVNATDALRANATGQYEWFYPDNQGREGLFMNIIALLFKFFGVSALTLKLPSILFGTLTVLGTYLLIKELFKREATALSGAAMTAFSFWSITMNRISFRANMMPFVLVFSFYFFFKGRRTGKLFDYALSGAFLGLGMHTYIAIRIAPAIFFMIALAMFISEEGFFKKYWKPMLTFFAAALIVAGPMLYTFFISHPEYLESRSSSISIFSPEVNKGKFWTTLSYTVAASLAKYNFIGDMNWRHNFPPFPLLDPIAGSAFLFGVAYSLFKATRLFWQRIRLGIQDEKLVTYAFLFAWFFAMLAPEFLTNEGLPHALRAIGTIPVVYIFGSIFFDYLFRKSENFGAIFRMSIYLFAIVTLATVGLFNTLKYHVAWANQKETAIAYEKVVTDAARYISTISQNKEVFMVAGNMQRIPARMFHSDRPGFVDMHPNDIDQIQPKNPSDFEIVFTDLDKDRIIESVRKNYPWMKLHEERDKFGFTFYIFK